MIVVLAAPLVLFGLVAALWMWLGPEDQPNAVSHNVSLAGSAVGGMDAAELADATEAISDRFGDTEVSIVAPKQTINVTAEELGISVDEGATRAAAMTVGRADPGPLAPLRWAKSYLSTRVAPVRLTIDRAKANSVLIDEQGKLLTKPKEPTLAATSDNVVLVPGVIGRALDLDQILSQIPEGLTAVGKPITVTTTPVETKPKIADATIAALVKRANDITATPLTLKVGDQSAEVDGSELRGGFGLDTKGASPTLTLDPDIATNLATKHIPTSSNPTGVMFDIVNGVPTPKPGKDAPVCCTKDAPRQIVDALLAGKKEVTLDTRVMTAAEGVEWAKTLGVKEVVGEFTTQHPCCAARVKNIHRMSDLTRGVLIAPGATFSANDFVGKRTKEKGFVSAGVIENGEFKEDFGGGVSQWATTTYNAAFFGGLDLVQHKAHSIYISRYPFGREATLAYPSVDLKIRNNTPHGIVIWPTYTGSSITVQMWGTKFATGAQTSINKTSGCGQVNGTRTRTYVDGRPPTTDKFSAVYNCNPPKH